jgi:hypothetical protein
MEPSSADMGNRKRPFIREGKEHVKIEQFATVVRHRMPAKIKETRENAKAAIRKQKLSAIKRDD